MNSVFHSDLRNCLSFITDFYIQEVVIQEIQGKYNIVNEKGR